jgi:hypothetical protein
MDRFAEIDLGQYLSDRWPRNRKLTSAAQHEVALQEAFGALHEDNNLPFFPGSLNILLY